jgi:hypothetical protein
MPNVQKTTNNRFKDACPFCYGKNNKNEGGTSTCFHCENPDCSYVECFHTFEDMVKIIKRRYVKFLELKKNRSV